MLPPVEGDDPDTFSVLRIPLPRHVYREWQETLTREQFKKVLEELAQLSPSDREAIVRLTPGSEMGHLLISRTGPACPPILSYLGFNIVHESVKTRLSEVPSIEFFPAYLRKIVPLQWDLGRPVPKKSVYYEPSSYIEDGNHSPEVAAQIGQFYEVVLPKVQWYPFDKVPKGKVAERVAFVGAIPRGRPYYLDWGRVELAFSASEQHPWVTLVPSDETIIGAYQLVREDVCELLREPGRWTLEFREVEQL